MCMSVYVYVYAYAHVYVYVYVYVYLYVHVYVHVYVYVRMYIYIILFMYIYMHVCMHACMYVCVAKDPREDGQVLQKNDCRCFTTGHPGTFAEFSCRLLAFGSLRCVAGWSSKNDLGKHNASDLLAQPLQKHLPNIYIYIYIYVRAMQKHRFQPPVQTALDSLRAVATCPGKLLANHQIVKLVQRALRNALAWPIAKST